MKKIFIMVILSTLFSACTFHIGRPHHYDDRYGIGYGMGYGSGCYAREDEMKTSLNLTNEQTKKIIDIDSKYREKYEKNRGDYDEIESLRFMHRKEIEEILTPEQKKKYLNDYNNRWNRRRHHRGPAGAGPGMMRGGGGGY